MENITDRDVDRKENGKDIEDGAYGGDGRCGECAACMGVKRKERSAKEYRDLQNRLKRIEGQVRGVQRMLDSDAYCTDILVQVSAITAALNSFNKALLSNHIRTCVAENIRQGNDEVVDELAEVIQKLMK